MAIEQYASNMYVLEKENLIIQITELHRNVFMQYEQDIGRSWETLKTYFLILY